MNTENLKRIMGKWGHYLSDALVVIIVFAGQAYIDQRVSVRLMNYMTIAQFHDYKEAQRDIWTETFKRLEQRAEYNTQLNLRSEAKLDKLLNDLRAERLKQ